MDLEFQIEEGQKSYIEKIEIRGNIKTKDKVIRRELAVAPGRSVRHGAGQAQQTAARRAGLFRTGGDPPGSHRRGPNRKNLIVDVEEKNTGNVSLGAGFSSVDSLVGFAEYNQGNFHGHRPGSAAAARSCGCRRRWARSARIMSSSFIEPWFLERKLQFEVNLFYRDYAFLSPNDIYTESRAGGRVESERALGSDFLRGGVSYSLENVGIALSDGANASEQGNVPNDILDTRLATTCCPPLGTSLAYDTRNSVRLPNKASAPS